MNLAIALAVFPVIFVAELPDKTMFASIVLSTRGRPGLVWLGAAGAFAVHVVIAVGIGAVLFRILPHRVVEIGVAGLFLAGAVVAIWQAVRARQQRSQPGHEAHGERIDHLAIRESAAHPQTVVAAFLVVFLAEWGDLTQIMIANLAARYHSPVSVGVGAALALWTVAAAAVAGGAALVRWVNIGVVRIITAAILVGLAGVTGWIALH